MPFKFIPLNLCKLQRDSRKQSKASLLAKYCYLQNAVLLSLSVQISSMLVCLKVVILCIRRNFFLKRPVNPWQRGPN